MARSKEWHKAYSKEWYKINKEEISRKKKEYYYKNRDKILARKRKYAKEHYDRLRAKSRVIKLELRTTKCYFCESTENLHFHHFDYEKDIGITLCSRCHNRIHQLNLKPETNCSL